MSKQVHEAEFTSDTSGFKKGADEVAKKGSWLTGKLKTLGGAIIAAFSIRAIANFGKQAVELASQIEGVRAAFGTLNKPDLLADLQKATRGTVTDLELMKKAVQARNFKIPLDQLATYFEFATKRAIQTGESVDYLVNSIITGIGRKSVLVMDNLGISAVALQDEVKKTGDFGQAAGNIIQQELKDMGDVADTTSTKIASLDTTFTNLKTNLGKLITKSKLFNDALNDINRTVTNLVDLQEDEATIQESSLSKWDKFIFRLAKFTKVGREAVSTMADGIRKQDEQNDVITDANNINEVHTKTIGDYKAEIESLTASLDTLTIGQGKEAEAIRNQIIQLQALIDATLKYKTIIATPAVTAAAPEMGGLLPIMDDAEWQSTIQSINDGVGEIELAYTSAQLAAAQFGEEIMRSSIEGAEGLKGFAQVAVQVAKRIIATYLAEGVAAAVKSALTKVPFPFNIIAAGVAGGAAAALFNSLVPNFAAGGAAYGPTLALVGEAPGISRSNPEYIGTAKQLAQMGLGGGRLSCEIKRDKFVFWLNEGNASFVNNY